MRYIGPFVDDWGSGNRTIAFLKQIQAGGGIITLGDLAGYQTRLEEPIQIDYNGIILIRVNHRGYFIVPPSHSPFINPFLPLPPSLSPFIYPSSLSPSIYPFLSPSLPFSIHLSLSPSLSPSIYPFLPPPTLPPSLPPSLQV